MISSRGFVISMKNLIVNINTWVYLITILKAWISISHMRKEWKEDKTKQKLTESKSLARCWVLMLAFGLVTQITWPWVKVRITKVIPYGELFSHLKFCHDRRKPFWLEFVVCGVADIFSYFWHHNERNFQSF